MIVLLLAIAIAIVIVLYFRALRKNKDISEQLLQQETQLGQLERELQSAKAGRHDIKNHLVTLRGLIQSDDGAQAIEYVNEMIKDNTSNGGISCGNAVVNSILGAKAEIMKHSNIAFNLDAMLPRRLNLQPTQLTTIISNLLDNAITAAGECELGYVDLQLKHSKGNLIIMVKNPFKGELAKENDVYLTTKKDKQNHGIGLKTVTTTVNRLGGSCDIEQENGVFSVFIMVAA